VVSAAKRSAPALALLVHPNMAVLSALQHSFEARGFHSVVSRDMPTAMLALSQHDFAVAVIYHRVVEDGDGFSVGAMARRIFPHAHIAVICGEKDVSALQAAINNRLDQVFDEHSGSEQVVDAILGKLGKEESASVQ
jgi:ActR/RegA family two-component response regulator